MSGASSLALPTTTPYDPKRQWKIDHAGKIDKYTAEVLVGIFAGFAILASALRLAFRLKHDRRLFAHDVLVIFATLTLIPLTAITYVLLPRMYIVEALNYDATVIFSLNELLTLLESPKWVFIFFALAWTVIFTIKYSFLVFFRPLIRNLSPWLEYYYWFSIVFTGIAWVLVCTQPAMLCPHVGLEAIDCYPSPSNLGLSMMVVFSDVLTDLIVVSFPIILLSMSRLELRKKLGIAVFLCLSLVMVIITIIRIAGGRRRSVQGNVESSMTWSHVLLHVEASVAVILGSVSAFRTIFAASGDEDRSTQTPKLYRRVLSKIGFLSGSSKATQDPSFVDKNRPNVPDVQLQRPGMTMQTLRNFIRRHDRSGGVTTLETLDSVTDINVEDYHQYRRKEAGPIKVNVTHEGETRQNLACTSAAGSYESEIPPSSLASASTKTGV